MYMSSRKKKAHLNFILLFCNDQDILNMKQKIQLNINAYRHNIYVNFSREAGCCLYILLDLQFKYILIINLSVF